MSGGKAVSRGVSRDRMLTTRTLGSVRRRQTKQGNVLLQDVDAGKPCLACKNCKEGFALHVWRKSCRNCYCKREDHDIGIVVDDPTDIPNMHLKHMQSGSADAPPEVKRTGRKWRPPSKSQVPLGSVSEEPEEEEEGLDDAFAGTSLKNDIVEENDSPYAWIPDGLTKRQVEKFMDMVPVDARPENTLEGQQKRARRRLHQLPPHDSDKDACSGVDNEAAEVMQNFVANRDTKDLGKGSVAEQEEIKSCADCSQTIAIGDMSVTSGRLPGQHFHPQCFVCTECKQFLVDLVHFVHEGKLYCGRHHAEMIFPRCGGCDELIFKGTYTVAQGKRWHPDHFCCMGCDNPLAAEKSEEFVQTKGNVVCVPCFESKFAKHCLMCEAKIGAGEEQLSSGEYQWHTKCFTCNDCKAVLDPSQFLLREKKLFCQKCYSGKFSYSCAKCKDPIDGTQRSLGVGDKKWHSSCFVCSGCQSELAGKPFVDHSSGLFCVPCYEKSHATRCKACSKVIGEAGGLRYKEDVYHEKCFVCSYCQVPLAGKKFVRKDDKFCCEKCFGEKLAPKCFACRKVIVKNSDGDDSFIAHQSNSWHIPCFVCSNCGKKLDGERFNFKDNALTCGLCL
ncbi:testin-like [Sycon ciliatum]|uniref:testin-like n=1 Tax=Sycon ciliatum TaxID=27933 RepID=UPI0020A9EA18|eukprot:scpid67437/ scgid29603/ Prickle-like protein 3; LIM domain only protein 6; Triple LIM domain protein 6